MSDETMELPLEDMPQDEMDKMMSAHLDKGIRESYNTVAPLLVPIKEKITAGGSLDSEDKQKLAAMMTYHDIGIAQKMAELMGQAIVSHVQSHAFFVTTPMGDIAIRVATGDDARKMIKEQEKSHRRYEALAKVDKDCLPINVMLQRMADATEYYNRKTEDG